MRRLLLSLLCGSLLVSPAGATWSIVLVDRRTGEVAIGAATCIAQFNLTRGLPAIVNGVGGAVVQASGDSANLPPVVAAMRGGATPSELLELMLTVEPSVPQLQTGIVTMNGPPVTFTGNGAGAAKLGVVGEVGDLAYAIQGNVLAGGEVVRQAERAVLEAEGDLSERLLAGMIAAREWGGDGRCSCSLENFGMDADDCGAPPMDFRKSAHTGFLLVSRPGDLEAPCVSPAGIDCANRGYHLRIVIRGAQAQIQDPDPVDQMVDRYLQWRTERQGHADGVLSRTSRAVPMPAGGGARQVIDVQLVDIEGNVLTHGDTRLEVVPTDNGGTGARILDVENHGDGTYSITVASAESPSSDTFQIKAVDEVVSATLYPFLEIESVAAGPLHVGPGRVSAAAGGEITLELELPERAGEGYVLLGSLAGGAGLPLASGLILPLSLDEVLEFTVLEAGNPEYLPGSVGRLDARGRARASFLPPAGALVDFVGQRLTWVGVVTGDTVALTNAAKIEVLP